MTARRTAFYGVGGALLVAYLAAANMPSQGEPSREREARPAATAGSTSIAADVSAQAEKLRARMAQAPTPDGNPRNPFAFGEARRTARGWEMVHPEYRTYDKEPPVPEPGLSPVYPTTRGLTQDRLRRLTAQLPSLDWPRDAGSPYVDLLTMHCPAQDATAADLATVRERLALDVELGLREDAVSRKLLGTLELGPGPVVGSPRRVELAVDVGQLLGRGIGGDLEEGVADLHLVADVDHAGFDDSGDLGLDRELLAGLDLPDCQGLLGDRALLDRDRLLRPVFPFSAARESVDAHGGGGQHEQQEQRLEELRHTVLPG